MGGIMGGMPGMGAAPGAGAAAAPAADFMPMHTGMTAPPAPAAAAPQSLMQRIAPGVDNDKFRNAMMDMGKASAIPMGAPQGMPGPSQGGSQSPLADYLVKLLQGGGQ